MYRTVSDNCPQCGAPLPPGGPRLTCAYCGASLVRQEAPPEGETTGTSWGVRLKTIVCTDQQGIGIEAFRFLIPADWEFEGGVHWLLNNPGMPAVIAFRARNPQGLESLEVFPNISCFWTNNPMTQMLFPIGSLYFGNEVRPPMPALQALRELVIPRYRGGVPGLQIVAQEHLPDLPRALQAQSPAAPSVPVQTDGARVRIRYQVGGQEVEEDIFGVVEITGFSAPTMMGVTQTLFWMVEYLFSFRAPAGHLDRLGDLFQGIVRSFRLNPEWFGRYLQVSQFLIRNQIQQIRHVGEISRIVSQNSSQISDMMMDTYYRRQETMDRLAEQFSQTIRGVDAYYDPFAGQGVELPGGYRYAWATPLGEYILTDDPNFNPNIGSTQTWERMERKA